jgi:hypothetical protein
MREPPAPIAHPVPPACVPRLRSEEVPTAPLTAIATSRARGVTKKHTAEPDIAAQPGPVTAAPASGKVNPCSAGPGKTAAGSAFPHGRDTGQPPEGAGQPEGKADAAG